MAFSKPIIPILNAWMKIVGPLLIISAVIFIRIGRAFEYPIPWSDETSFIAQAYSLYTTGSLFNYGLNPERALMWMPPGYMVLLAATYKILGYSFDISRWVSSLFYIAAYIVTLKLAYKIAQGRSLLFLTFITTFCFMSPYGLAISNIARMESLYIFLFSLSSLCYLNGYRLAGLSLALIAATVHFNAFYFLLPYTAYALHSVIFRKKITFHLSELAAASVSVSILALYLILIFNNLHGFIEDMQFQFGWKSLSRAEDTTPLLLISISLIFALIVLAFINKRNADPIVIACFGVAHILLKLNGYNMWYEFSLCTGILLIIFSLAMSVSHDKRPRINQLLRFAVIALTPVLIYFANHPTRYFSELQKQGLDLSTHFLERGTIEEIKSQLRTLPANSQITFGYSGVEPFFFEEMSKAGIQWQIPTYSPTQKDPLRKIDYRIFCDSPMFPSYVQLFDEEAYKRKGLFNGCKIIKI